MSSLTENTRNGALKRNLLVLMLKSNVFKFGEFQLKSGQISPIYIDLRECFGHHELAMLISEAISQQIESSGAQYSGVLGIPYAALPFASIAASNYLKKPLLIVRKEAKSYGTKKLIEGLYQPNDCLVLIEDVVTTGGSILDVVKTLHAESLTATDVFCILDKEQGGSEKLQNAGITLHSLLDMNTVLTFLFSTGAISEAQWFGIVQALNLEYTRPISSILCLFSSLKSHHLETQMMSLKKILAVVKNNEFESLYTRIEIEQIIETLFDMLLPRDGESDDVIRSTCEILLQFLLILPHQKSRTTDKIFVELNEKLMNGSTWFQQNTPYSIYEIVMKRAGNVDKVYAQTAMVLLTHLCCKMYLMKRVFLQERPSDTVLLLQQKLMDFLIKSLQSPDTKLKVKGFAVSIIKNLSSRNSYIKQMAQSFGIIRIFFDIMRNEFSDEDFLWPTMQALTAFCSDSANGNLFVSLGGAQVLCGLLSHGSTRLLYELLGCMRKLADLPAIQHQDMRESIWKIVSVMNTDDLEISASATNILLTLGSNSNNNLLLIIEFNVIPKIIKEIQKERTHENSNSAYRRDMLAFLNLATSLETGFVRKSAEYVIRQIATAENGIWCIFKLLETGETYECASTCEILSSFSQLQPNSLINNFPEPLWGRVLSLGCSVLKDLYSQNGSFLMTPDIKEAKERIVKYSFDTVSKLFDYDYSIAKKVEEFMMTSNCPNPLSTDIQVERMSEKTAEAFVNLVLAITNVRLLKFFVENASIEKCDLSAMLKQISTQYPMTSGMTAQINCFIEAEERRAQVEKLFQ